MAEKMYDDESTGASKAELMKFANWCKQRFSYEPAIIGGWAVYAYAKKEMSIDIDVVFGTRKESEKIMESFFMENGHKAEELHEQPKHFVKELKLGARKTALRFDYYSYEDRNQLVENRDIEIPWGLIEGNSTYKTLNGLSIRVPCIELLLMLKVKALRDRQAALDMRGIRIDPGQRARIKSKIAKDERDIADLIATGLADSSKLEDLLKQTGFEKNFNESLKGLAIVS